MQIDLDLIVKTACRTIRIIQRGIAADCVADPETAFDRISFDSWKKRLATIDLVAQVVAARRLRDSLKGYDLVIIGEENLRSPDLDLTNKEGLVVLMDMIDGTDLLERDLSNWCSALIFYSPLEKKILASFVGIPNDGVYYALDGTDGAFKRSFLGHHKTRRVRGLSSISNLETASACTYNGTRYG